MSSTLKFLKSIFVSIILVLAVSYLISVYFKACSGGGHGGDQLTLKSSEKRRDTSEKLEVANIPSLQEQATKAIQDTNLGQAEKIYNQILEVSPKNVDALYGLGVVFTQGGDDAKATETLHEVFNLSSEKIQVVLQDPRFDALKDSKHFHDLLRIHNTSIPEMNPQMNNPPIQTDN